MAALSALLPCCAQSVHPAERGPALDSQGAEASVLCFVQERLTEWKRRLNLEDWKVTVNLLRRDELKPGTLGGIRWDKKKKSAVMSLLHPSEYQLPAEAVLKDLEFTIVHELVHLELATLPKSEASRSQEEQAVNRLTEALLSLAGRL
jgi:hypothetical protein